MHHRRGRRAGADPAAGAEGPLSALLDEPALDLLAAGLPVVREGVLGATAAAAACAALERMAENSRPARIGKGGRLRSDSTVRSDTLRWIEPQDAEEAPDIIPLLRMFEQLRGELAAGLRVGLHRYSLQLATFAPGGVGYRRHQDQQPGGPNRVLTAIWYANPAWNAADGGALRVWLPSDSPRPNGMEWAPIDESTHPEERPADLLPLCDRLVLFLSAGLPHAVLPAGRPRRALTAWYHGREDVPLLPDPTPLP